MSIDNGLKSFWSRVRLGLSKLPSIIGYDHRFPVSCDLRCANIEQFQCWGVAYLKYNRYLRSRLRFIGTRAWLKIVCRFEQDERICISLMREKSAECGLILRIAFITTRLRGTMTFGEYARVLVLYGIDIVFEHSRSFVSLQRNSRCRLPCPSIFGDCRNNEIIRRAAMPPHGSFTIDNGMQTPSDIDECSRCAYHTYR